jgi:Spx/MgsR family transcriptional regulator
MKKVRFFWKSTCTTCRDARSFLRTELGADLDERDYAKIPLSADELKDLFAGRDPRDYLNPRSPAFKAMRLAGKPLTPAEALALMAKEPNLIKRPITIAGKQMLAGFDREKLRQALK